MPTIDTRTSAGVRTVSGSSAPPVSNWVEDRDVEHVLYSSALAAIGCLASPPGSSYFRGEHTVTNFLVAFPRSALWIHQDRGSRFVADATVATMYNRGQVFRRGPISNEGDVAEWFAVSEDVARDAVAAHDRAAAEGDTPVRFTRAPVGASLYRRQRTVSTLARQRALEPDQVDELVIHLFGDVVDSAYRAARRAAVRDARTRRALVERARAVIAASYRQNLSVAGIAERCESSVYHLCRVFKWFTGQTLHGYRRDLRLRAALGDIQEYRGDLARLAVDLGFFSHSHFTGAFTRQFGVAPNAWPPSATARTPLS